MSSSNNAKSGIPRPIVHYDNAKYWESIKKHELVLQKCKSCAELVHPPRPVCPKCRSLEKEWIPVTGLGEIYSWTTYYQSPDPSFTAPYSVVLVELEEGVRIISSLVDCKPEEIRFKMPVQIVYDDIADDFTLPRFRKAV